MRYVGQNYELPIALPEAPLGPRDLPALLDAFHRAHDRAYGYAAPGEPAQFVTFRLEAAGRAPAAELPRAPRGGAPAEARVGVRPAYLPESGGWADLPLYDRGKLGAGAALDGPAVVEQMDATTLVLPGQRVAVDDYGNLLLTDAHDKGV
jgi:N-methylhydantoinase A